MAQMPTPTLLRMRLTADAPLGWARQLGVVPTYHVVRALVRPLLVAFPSNRVASALRPTAAPADVAPLVPQRKSIIVVYHKMGGDKDRPSGMDIRMNQIVSGLVAMRFAVHFVCHCDVHPSQLSPFEPSVVIYMGTLKQQFEQAVAAATPMRAVLIFYTTLTMHVHQRMLNGEDWHLEPTSQLPEEQVLEMVHAGSMKGERTCTYAVADDIHYLRSVEVMGRYDPEKAKLASAWIKKRELGFHAAVDGTATVSLEAHMLASVLPTRRARDPVSKG